MDDQVRYEQAKKRVRQIEGFYVHLAVYVLVNAFLLVINLVASPNSLWFYWPLLGWGIGIVAHAASVFGSGRFWGRDWEERKIKELMDK
ncbi:MAG TPA: 2TM domain-containing protein [bacterium]|nr:2TM domain-containing protein [bacterium]